MITLNAYSSMDESIKHLLPELTVYIEQSIHLNNRCVLALAGGNTPKPLYKALSTQGLPWSQISITLTDERWVSGDHVDSNENMIKQILINAVPTEPYFIPLKSNAGTVEVGAIEAHKLLTEKSPSLDVVILGMGEDGHFASIFPGVSNLDALISEGTHEKCLAVYPNGKQDRISLTFAYLTRSKIIFLVVSGDKKKAIIDGSLEGRESHQDYPIWKLLNQTICPVKIYWNA